MITVAVRTRLLRAALALCLLAPAVGCADALEPWTGGPTPALTGKTLDGGTFALADYPGRVVIVNFWATWCVPCVVEMPSLQRLRERLAPRRVEVVAVNFQENAARIAPFVERMGITFPVVRDHDGTIRAAWNVTVFPTTFVVGPDRRIAFVATGEVDWDDPRVESRILRLDRATGQHARAP
jgi:thiol-disulfide isomerase/thioredoxin